MLLCRDILSIILDKLILRDNPTSPMCVYHKLKLLYNLKLTCKHNNIVVGEITNHLTRHDKARLIRCEKYIPITILSKLYNAEKVSDFVVKNINFYDVLDIINNTYLYKKSIKTLYQFININIDIFNNVNLGNIRTEISRKDILIELINRGFIISKKFYINNVGWFDDKIVGMYVETLSKKFKLNQLPNLIEFIYDVNTYNNISIIKNKNELCSHIKNIITMKLTEKINDIKNFLSYVETIHLYMSEQKFKEVDDYISNNSSSDIISLYYPLTCVYVIIRMIKSKRSDDIMTFIKQLILFLRYHYDIIKPYLSELSEDEKKFIEYLNKYNYYVPTIVLDYSEIVIRYHHININRFLTLLLICVKHFVRNFIKNIIQVTNMYMSNNFYIYQSLML
jgi:hypothetical protein